MDTKMKKHDQEVLYRSLRIDEEDEIDFMQFLLIIHTVQALLIVRFITEYYYPQIKLL